MTRDEAQRRADQIRAFRAEVAALARDGIDVLPPERAASLAAHHDALLASLAARFDVDRSEAGRRLSLGMRLASGFGAAALTAAIVSFFSRIWGGLSEPLQVILLTAAPLAALAAMVVAARRERTHYIASLCALVACGAFVLQTVLLGDLFNLRGGAHALAWWAAFGLAAAVPFRVALPFAAAVAASIVCAAALLVSAAGAPWSSFASRLETVLLPAAAAWAAWRVAPRELQPWMRGTALACALVALLGLSTFEAASLLPLPPRVAAGLYQVAAAVLAFAVVWHGLRAGQRETVVIGATFAGAFLLGRFFDWWWDWMPKYLFFLVLGLSAIAAIALLRRLRARFGEAA